MRDSLPPQRDVLIAAGEDAHRLQRSDRFVLPEHEDVLAAEERPAMLVT